MRREILKMQKRTIISTFNSSISNPKNHVISRISWGLLFLLGVTFTVKVF
jgi:hypothetical protein